MNIIQMWLRATSLLQRYYNRIKIALFESRGVIFVFHEVDTANRHGVESSCFCFVDTFRQLLVQYKGQFCSLDEFLTNDEGKKVVITFDDVPESIYTHAYPLLCEQQVPFVLYLSPKFIDKEGFLSVNQIKEMAKNQLCTIGAHTMKHTKLRMEIDSYDDIYQSKVEVETIVGKTVEHLAYPYGRADSVSRKVRNEARNAGFKSATCTIPTEVPKRFDRWYMPRVTVINEFTSVFQNENSNS